jgi:NAD-dependent dihydropyrimidine dehydrogenase PreA subunit
MKINGISVGVADGATVLDAAQEAGVEIPTLCHLKGCEPETACMLCVVKNLSTGQLIPACSALASEGMEIDTECEEVQSARRDILNLLLSEHVGDCQAPCQRICPAHLDIPLMLREIERGNLESAAWIARRDLAIPVVLGTICPAPCEKGCRRGQMDECITIRSLHRQAAESFQSLDQSFPEIGKTVAVIGSGPAGLSCAWKLRQLGYTCTVFDEDALAGGALRDIDHLPAEVLSAEIEWLRSAGIHFELSSSPNASDFDAVVEPDEHKLAVMAVARGKSAALKLAGDVEAASFDFKCGKLRDREVLELAKNCTERTDGSGSQQEAARCLHCDCRKPVSCKLRRYAEQYGASQREFTADERKHVQLIGQNETVVFEEGKCIKCGLCVKVTKAAGEELGVTFVGRGYNAKIAVPFDESLQSGLRKAASECVKICPVGALAFRDAEERQ